MVLCMCGMLDRSYKKSTYSKSTKIFSILSYYFIFVLEIYICWELVIPRMSCCRNDCGTNYWNKIFRLGSSIMVIAWIMEKHAGLLSTSFHLVGTVAQTSETSTVPFILRRILPLRSSDNYLMIWAMYLVS